MLNREESRALTACHDDMMNVQTAVNKDSIFSEIVLGHIKASHKTIAAVVTIGGKRMNSEERRVLREANQQLYLSCEDIEKHNDQVAAVERLTAFRNLVWSVIAGEIKAKR